MWSKAIEKVFNAQITMESNASISYLAMSCWCSTQGIEGAATFFAKQAEEERMHMLKFLNYVKERNGTVVLEATTKPKATFDDLEMVIKTALIQEKEVSQSINKMVEIAIADKDFASQGFLLWFVNEQIEEENQFSGILDKIKLIGNVPSALYLIDKHLSELAAQPE